MFSPLKSIFGPVLKDIFTNKVETFEPIRVVGIPSFFAGVVVYLVVTIMTVIREGHINWVEWSTGFTALMASLIALATAMRLKENTENQPDTNNLTPPPTPVDVTTKVETTVTPKT